MKKYEVTFFKFFEYVPAIGFGIKIHRADLRYETFIDSDNIDIYLPFIHITWVIQYRRIDD